MLQAKVHYCSFLWSLSSMIGMMLVGFIAPVALSAQASSVISMKEGLMQIEARFSCSFLYESAVLKGQYVESSILEHNPTLTTILEQIEEDSGLEFNKIEDGFWVVQPQHPYGRIQGFIYDQEGLPLVGASIYDPISERGAATNIEGFFDFWIPAGDVHLQVSFIGFQPKEIDFWLPFGKKEKLELALDPSVDLTEIVVWGGTETSLTSIAPTALTERVTEEDIKHLAANEIGQLLQFSAPSFHTTYQTISDGTDHIDPASLRGLGPDQMLVLVNGKRRYQSALVNVNSTVGRGSVSTDLNAIPIAAIKSIEILADGATAQYGADAIAGVINLVLKDSLAKDYVKVFSGVTQQGDGFTLGLNAFHQIYSNKRGHLDLSWRIDRRTAVNRSGNYTGRIFDDPRDSDPASIGAFFEQTPFQDRRVMLVGSANIQNYGLHFNHEWRTNKDWAFYQFGGVNVRFGEAGGFYRFPYQKRKQSGLYPMGFSPEIRPRILDYSWVLGMGKQWDKWSIDISQNIGANSVDFYIETSNNASMGLASPTSAHGGQLQYGQIIWQLDALRHNTAKTSTWRMGASWRNELFKQSIGDEWSWKNYGQQTDNGTPKEAGIQVFPGFGPANTARAWRPSWAAYLGLDQTIKEHWIPSAAIRWEYWPESGQHLLGKLGLKYKPVDQLQFRLAANTALRSASLPQRYFSSQSLQFVPEGNKLVGRQIAQLNDKHPLLDALGVAHLKAEQSYNFSIGGQWNYKKNIYLDVGVYHINIYNRIILGSRINGQDSQLIADALEGTELASIQFFTNALDTESRGVDISAKYQWQLMDHHFNIRLASSFNQTKVKAVELPQELADLSEVIFNREDQARLEKAQPVGKVITQFQWSKKRWSSALQMTRFGEVTYLHPNDGQEENWAFNDFTQQIESRDQVFTPKWVTDISCHLKIGKKCSLALYGRNIFDIYPDQHQHSANTNDGIFVYSRYVQQFGVWGANYMLEFEMNL